MRAPAPFRDGRVPKSCAGPHCNGADRAAAHLAALGLPVKVMIGGATGWADEGLAFDRDG